eukprot:m.29762 g.29762  ORF g.29762 m.29762 type:complete len:270 (+) comp31226_c0_seq5:29-838(+)
MAQAAAGFPISEWLPCKERVNVEQIKTSFRENGFINEAGFLKEDEVRQVKNELERYRENVVPRISSKYVFYEDKSRLDSLIRLEQMHTFDDFFRQLSESPVINGLADLLLGEPCEANNVQFFSKPPGAKATPPHQDGQYFMHDRGMTFWLALDKADKVNGCMYYVPGSYRGGLLEHKKGTALGFSQSLVNYPEDFLKREVCMEASSGTLLGHHPYTVHRAGPNTDVHRWRIALGLTYWAKACKDNKQLQEEHRTYREQIAAELEAEGKI